MALGTTADKRLSNRWHFDGSLHSRDHAKFFHSIFHNQRVHYCRQHTHVVSSGPIDSSSSSISSPPHIASSNNHCNFYTQCVNALDLLSNASDSLSINTKALGTKSFTTEF